MPLRLKTKFTLLTALLVLGVAGVIATLYTTWLTREQIREVDDRARNSAESLLRRSSDALKEAADRGEAPANDTEDGVRAYVRQVLKEDPATQQQIELAVSFFPAIYDVAIVDPAGIVLVSSDASLENRPVARRENFSKLVTSSFVEQLRELRGPQRVYEVTAPFRLGEGMGEVRIGLSTALLRDSILSGIRSAFLLALAAVVISTVVAALASNAALRPLDRISAQLDRIAQEASVSALPASPKPASQKQEAGDELGIVSSKVTRIGEQIRGVREIFSTLRENLNQVMAGMDDGLVLFGADGRTVLASPAVEKFLGQKPDALMGKTARDIFSPQSSLGRALRFDGQNLAATDAREVPLDGADGSAVRRAVASVQVISGAGAPGEDRAIGALLTLRDFDSIERLGSQLEVSERLAALGRVTAGVAHEVKNPLNSMRLWIENLKENLPPGEEEPRKAVKILDSEIDRLDRVVRTFLDFTRPVELRFEETSLAELCNEVLALAQPQIAQGRISVTREFDPSQPVTLLDRALMKQAVLNLVLNACEAMPEGGTLALRLRRDSEMAELSVRDTGRGIPPEVRHKVYQL
jgi:nitrogen-specific signal transduction histidine kinase